MNGQRTIGNIVDDMGVLIGRVSAIYEKLAGMAREMCGFIEKGETDKIVGVLERKNALLNEVDSVMKKLEPLKAELTASAPVPEQEKDKLNGMLDGLTAVYAKLRGEEDIVMKMISDRKNAVPEEISQLVMGKKAMSAYARKKESGPTMLDQSK